jgi:hypothetical protein
MGNHIFTEEKYYPKTKLLKTFSGEDLVSLCSYNILKGGDGNSFKFSFVGVVSLNNIAFCIIPKVHKSNNYEGVIKDTIDSLKIYCNDNTQLYAGIDYFDIEPDNPNCSELAIAEFLIEDFQRNGIYIVEDEKIEINGSGDVNWPQTVLEVNPIYSNMQPIYCDTINHVVIDDREHLTIAIHKWSIGYVSQKYNELLGIEEMALSFEYENNLEKIGSDEQLIRHLQSQLQVTFSDRGIRLLKSLIFLIIQKANRFQNELTLFGTKKYENVWEEICKKVTNDSYPKIKKNYTLFPNPKWKIFDKNKLSSSDLRPDILSLDEKRDIYYLFDAKYYQLEFEDKINGEPGYKDILKQFIYHEHIEDLFIGKTVFNALLFPVLDDDFEEFKDKLDDKNYNQQRAVIGCVTYDLNVYKNKKISIIMCPFSKWQQMYIQHKSLAFSDIFWDG